MASPKIGSKKDGKKVTQLSSTELGTYLKRGGKDSAIAEKELRRRGVKIEDVVL